MDLQTIGLFITVATDLFWQFKLLSLQFTSSLTLKQTKKKCQVHVKKIGGNGNQTKDLSVVS